jgi:hypothetical protein
MKAKEVIRIGRKRGAPPRPPPPRWRAAHAAQVARELDDQDGVLARQRDQQDQADLV